MPAIEAVSEASGAVVGRGNGPNGECITCDGRRYVDGSSDGGVSFQTPTHISPQQSFSEVRAHEYEHIRRDRASVESEGREVVYQSVRFFMSTCAECGQTYKSGGEARTVSRGSSDSEQQELPHEHEMPSVDTYV